MHISNERAFHLSETADFDVLADSSNLVGEVFGHLLVGAGNGALHKSVGVSNIVVENSVCDFLNHCKEFVGLRAEVGFAVDFSNNADIASGHCLNNALSGNSARLLSSLCKTLLTKNFNSLIAVAVCFLKRSLAVHHSAAGHIAQLFNVLCSYISHFLSPYINYSSV